VCFLGAVHSHAKWPVRPQLKQMLPELPPAAGGAGRCGTGDGGGRAFGAAYCCGHGCGWKTTTATATNVDADVVGWCSG
jgi:hypothetical protein